ncbi:hypothetical protein [Paraburkholderia youngii]|uniref:hypothetical protein n=1 Tax=Paraburkholderia youngii TaxID=2782701 RepID=UPI0020CE567C|nr:hypothetical protein [Paraburkholderia youngii]
MIEAVFQFQLFGQAQLLTGGGPNNASRPLVQFIYESGFRQWLFGYSAAAAQDRRRVRPVALETAKLMRAVDPTIQLAACGSSTHDMPTYGAREDRVLEHCFDQVDFISLHTYFENRHDSTAEFFGNIDVMDLFIKEIVAVADSAAARKHSSKRIMLSFDEWNVWYKARSINDLRKPGWPSAPRLIEEHPRLSKWLPGAGALARIDANPCA